MMKSTPIRNPARPGEEGFGLLAVIFLVALLTLSLAVAMPKVIKQLQRDRELETMRRGKQYARAVRMYYKKFGSYPPNADVLIKGVNNIRFLRKKYTDPTTGLPDWKPVLFGQNKAPTAMGFFGQPLGGIGGCTPVNPLDASNQANGASAALDAGSAGPLNTANTNCPGTGLNTSAGSTGASSTNPADPNAANSSTDPNAAGNGSTTTSAFGQPGQAFGGAGIIGFSPNSPKPSIMVYKTKTH